jgi:Tat protein translocase TatB subunit
MLAMVDMGIGVGEWFVLFVVLLIVMGPKRLPEAARKIGEYSAKIRRAAESFKRQLMDMDREVTSYADSVVKEAENAMSIEGDEADVIPESDEMDETSDDYISAEDGAEISDDDSDAHSADDDLQGEIPQVEEEDKK